jgi:hypothetical protein
MQLRRRWGARTHATRGQAGALNAQNRLVAAQEALLNASAAIAQRRQKVWRRARSEEVFSRRCARVANPQ